MIQKLLALFRELPRIWPLMLDGRVPLFAKISAILAAILIVSPLDLLGDIPVLGLIDDAALLALVVHLFVRFSEGRVAQPAPQVRNVTPHDEVPTDRPALP